MTDRRSRCATSLGLTHLQLHPLLRSDWPSATRADAAPRDARRWTRLHAPGITLDLCSAAPRAVRLQPVARLVGFTPDARLAAGSLELLAGTDGPRAARVVTPAGDELALWIDHEGVLLARLALGAEPPGDWTGGWAVAPWLRERLVEIPGPTGWSLAVRAGLVHRLWTVDASERARYRLALVRGEATPTRRVAAWVAQVTDRVWRDVVRHALSESARLDALLGRTAQLAAGPPGLASDFATQVATLRDDLQSAWHALSISGRSPEDYARAIGELDQLGLAHVHTLERLPGGLPHPWRAAARAVDRAAWWPRIGG